MQKTCRLSGKQFTITEADQKFYEQMGVPLPTLCPQERMRRRLAFRNESKLYHRKCDKTGKQIISSASADKPYPNYSIDAWWSDDWSALDYGRDFDFNRPFFEQFSELQKQVPRLALQQQKPMENSDYCNCASRNKNCYLIFSTNHCEDCYYGSWINFSTDCIDNENSLHNELCYETIDCNKCYNLIYCEECYNCSDSAFLKNCIGSKNCLFSTNLRNAEYYIYNQKVTPEQYQEFKQQLDLGSYQNWLAAIQKFNEIKAGSIVKYYYGTNNENSTGNYISNCKDCQSVYECFDCENVSYANNMEVKVKDCLDHSYWGNGATLTYECHACGYDIYNLRFCNLCWSSCNNLTYCDHCFSSQDCFGCVGLKKAKFCIFNKQYSEEEYYELVEKMIKHMRQTQEFGEFLPINLSPFAYNETLAQEWFPLSETEANQLGYLWHTPETNNNFDGHIPELTDHLKNAPANLTSQILKCVNTGKLYKIIPQELKFLQKMNLPIPRLCPEERHKQRMHRRNPRQLWDRQCGKCQITVQTTYKPTRPEVIYCEQCYLNQA